MKGFLDLIYCSKIQILCERISFELFHIFLSTIFLELFLLREEDGMVPELVTSIVALDVNSHPALIATSINLLGGCNEWLEKHRVYLGRTILFFYLLLSKLSKFV